MSAGYCFGGIFVPHGERKAEQLWIIISNLSVPLSLGRVRSSSGIGPLKLRLTLLERALEAGRICRKLRNPWEVGRKPAMMVLQIDLRVYYVFMIFRFFYKYICYELARGRIWPCNPGFVHEPIVGV